MLEYVVEADWNSGRIFGLTDICTDAVNGKVRDHPCRSSTWRLIRRLLACDQGCTLVECTLGSSSGVDPNCNLSSYSGWNAAVVMTLGPDTRTCMSAEDAMCNWINGGNDCQALPDGRKSKYDCATTVYLPMNGLDQSAKLTQVLRKLTPLL